MSCVCNASGQILSADESQATEKVQSHRVRIPMKIAKVDTPLENFAIAIANDELSMRWDTFVWTVPIALKQRSRETGVVVASYELMEALAPQWCEGSSRQTPRPSAATPSQTFFVAALSKG